MSDNENRDTTANGNVNSENAAESEPSEAIVLSPEAMQAIITSAVSAALANMNLSQSPIDNRQPHVRLADISEQISQFGGDCEEDVENWLKRIDIVKATYNLSDSTISLLATNKLTNRARDWYNSQAELANLPWCDLRNKLKLTFKSVIDRLSLFDKMQARRWRKSEKIEEYFHDKLKMLNKLNVPTEDSILHIIRGVENTILRVQLKSQNFHATEDLFTAMKSYADELPVSNPAVPTTRVAKKPDKSDRNIDVTQVKCYNCNKLGHYSSSCPQEKRAKGACFHCNELGHQLRDCPKKKSKEANFASPMHAATPVCTTSLKIEEHHFRALIDTGSSVNIVRERVAKLTRLPVQPNHDVYTGLGNTSIHSCGQIQATTCIENAIYDINFSVVPDSATRHDVIIGEPFFRMATVIIGPEGMKIAKLPSPEPSPWNEILNISTEPQQLVPQVNPDLQPEDLNRLHNLLQKYEKDLRNPKPTVTAEARIVLCEQKEIVHRPRRLAIAEQQQVKQIVDNLLEEGIVRPSKSNYCSPVVITKKKSGEPRMCVDYRALNAITVKERYPLPVIEDVLDKLCSRKWFTLLDLKNGFHHIKMADDSVKYTSFVLPFGQFEYVNMPFGLTNAPSCFQRYINAVLNDLIRADEVVVYLDDCMIATDTLEKNLAIVEKVLDLFARNALRLRIDKCYLLMNEIEYLGYNINGTGIRPSVNKIKAVERFPEPKNVRDVQSFLGLAGYFRRFIKHFSVIAKPLTDLTRKTTPFVFGTEQRIAFDKLKRELVTKPTLCIFNPKLQTELHTDASAKGFGAILLQRQENGKIHPVSYYSSKTSDVESAYHSFELEALAIVKALARFRVYLLGIDFTIVTDCNGVKKTLKKREICPRINRWCLAMQEFRCKLEHRKRDSMNHVDALSRNPVMLVDNDLVSNLKYAQYADRDINKIIDEVNTGGKRINNEYVVSNGLLFRNNSGKTMLVVPNGMRRAIVTEYHDKNAHIGREKVVSAIQGFYWFRNMSKYVKQHIKNCLVCIQYNDKYRREGMVNLPDKGDIPFKILHLDHFGPLCRTPRGNMHVLVIVDALSKFVFLKPVKRTDTSSVINWLKTIFPVFGTPRVIITDRGTAFTSSDFGDFCSNQSIKHVKVAVSTPAANGQAERYVKSAKNALVKCSDSENWDSKCEFVQTVLNNTVQKSIGMTPSKLLLGYSCDYLCDQEIRDLIRTIDANEPVEFCELRAQASERIKTFQKYNKYYADAKRVEPFKYQVKDLVCIRRPYVVSRGESAFVPKFFGPYVVTKILDNDRYVIEDVPGLQHTQRFYTTIASPQNMKLWSPADELVGDD